jgi:murein DD-endopeptidase MepM/ murein hydrolase activator NlpD
MQRRKVLQFALTIVLIVAVVAAIVPTWRAAVIGTNSSSDSVEVVIEIREPSFAYGMIVDDYSITEGFIKKNQMLGDLLEENKVPARLIHQLSTLSREIFDVRRIAPNRKYTLFRDLDSIGTLKALVYEPNPIDYVVIQFGDSLQVENHRREVVTVERTVTGVINSTLSHTIEDLGISHELTNKFVDIFAWQVDFQRLQKGDRFKLIYEEDLVEGQSVGIKGISAIYFEHFNSPYYAFPYDQGNGLDYFDDEGNSLRKALLKYPIEFTRISSRYSGRRFHPVQKVYKAHLGTDFAAPTGTPIRTVGDGIVLEAQYKSNNGNYVKIRHNSTYTTQYLHMSKIASGVRAGVRVRQGQTIGFVGSTGLATGPHLCYRFWRNDVQVDALRVELPPSEPIMKEHQASFEEVRKALTARLDSIPFQEPVPQPEQLASLR